MSIRVQWQYLWYGPRFTRAVRQLIVNRLRLAAHVGELVARQHVPVDTGATRNSIASEVDDRALTASVSTKTGWTLFIELGTRHMAPRPFLRTALLAMARAFGLPSSLAVGFSGWSSWRYGHGTSPGRGYKHDYGRTVRIGSRRTASLRFGKMRGPKSIPYPKH